MSVLDESPQWHVVASFRNNVVAYKHGCGNPPKRPSRSGQVSMWCIVVSSAVSSSSFVILFITVLFIIIIIINYYFIIVIYYNSTMEGLVSQRIDRKNCA